MYHWHNGDYSYYPVEVKLFIVENCERKSFLPDEDRFLSLDDALIDAERVKNGKLEMILFSEESGYTSIAIDPENQQTASVLIDSAHIVYESITEMMQAYAQSLEKFGSVIYANKKS